MQILLSEINVNAKLMEEHLWELSYQLKMKTEECERLRHFLDTSVSKHQLDDQPDEIENEALRQTQDMLQRRLAELNAEILRDKSDKLRMVKAVDSLLHGTTSMTLSEATVLAGPSSKSAAGVLLNVLRSLPQSNLDVLSAGQFFEFAGAAISTATQQYQRSRLVDIDRSVLSGVAHTGQKLSMNVVLQAITQSDFDKL